MVATVRNDEKNATLEVASTGNSPSSLSRRPTARCQRRTLAGSSRLSRIVHASYAFGPGVVVWLMLSELMPTRIRSSAWAWLSC